MEKILGASAPPRFGDKKLDWDFPHRDLTDRILGAAIQVHRRLGPGFLEKMYENALCLEFTTRGLSFDRQVPVRVRYEGTEIGMHRLDLIMERKVVVEVKAVKEIEDVHLAGSFLPQSDRPRSWPSAKFFGGKTPHPSCRAHRRLGRRNAEVRKRR